MDSTSEGWRLKFGVEVVIPTYGKTLKLLGGIYTSVRGHNTFIESEETPISSHVSRTAVAFKSTSRPTLVFHQETQFAQNELQDWIFEQ